MYYQIVRAKGKIFTVEVQADMQLTPQGKPDWTNEGAATVVYVTVSPRITPGDIFESVMPDMPEFEFCMATPSTMLFTQEIEHGSLGGPGVFEYLHKQAYEMVKLLDALELGQYFKKR